MTHLADEAGLVWKRFEVTAQSTFVLIDADGTVTGKGRLDADEVPGKVGERSARRATESMPDGQPCRGAVAITVVGRGFDLAAIPVPRSSPPCYCTDRRGRRVVRAAHGVLGRGT